MNRLSIFYVPIASMPDAQYIIEILLKEKYIACGNICKSDSMYTWENKMVTEQEYVMILKTIPSFTTKVEHKINELHSYEIPAILCWEVTCNASYFNWVKNQLHS